MRCGSGVILLEEGADLFGAGVEVIGSGVEPREERGVGVGVGVGAATISRAIRTNPRNKRK